MRQLTREAIERRIAQLERIENRASLACGGVLAGAYFFFQLFVMQWIATYTWLIPFAIGYAAPRLWFASRVTKLDRLLRDPEPDKGLPEARVIALPPVVTPVASAAPERVEPTPDGAGPSVLK